MGMVRESEDLQKEIYDMVMKVPGLELDFGETMVWLRRGGRACRRTWYERDKKILWIQIRNKPYLELKISGRALIPWVATQEDLMAEDWILLGYPKE